MMPRTAAVHSLCPSSDHRSKSRYFSPERLKNSSIRSLTRPPGIGVHLHIDFIIRGMNIIIVIKIIKMDMDSPASLFMKSLTPYHGVRPSKPLARVKAA